MSKQRIKLNRRFRRDLAQLHRQGHNLTFRFAPTHRRSLLFQANGGEDMTPNELMQEAARWREPMSPERIAAAEAEAAELARLIKWVESLSDENPSLALSTKTTGGE